MEVVGAAGCDEEGAELEEVVSGNVELLVDGSVLVVGEDVEVVVAGTVVATARVVDGDDVGATVVDDVVVGPVVDGGASKQWEMVRTLSFEIQWMP